MAHVQNAQESLWCIHDTAQSATIQWSTADHPKEKRTQKESHIVPNYLMSYEQLLEMEEDDKALKKRVLAPPASIVLQQRKTAYKRVPSSFLGPSLIKRFRVARPSANLNA